MTTFQSTATINRPVNEVYLFLSDFNNHRQLMPDSIEDWISTFDEASFNIQNMVKLSLKIESREENKEIKIVPVEKPPFNLALNWNLSSNNNQTDIIFTITADLNMMMKMVASGPLQKLADHETMSLISIFN
jgi:hypothetical protein